MKLRTRYRIVFLYREDVDNKCEGTPLYYKLSGAVDGDAYEQYVGFAEEVFDAIPEKCIIKEGSGVCIVTYIQKEPLKKVKFTPETFTYKKKVDYVFGVRKDGVKIAYKKNMKTGKKKQINFKKARKNYNSQQGRVRKQTKTFEKKEKVRMEEHLFQEKQKATTHRMARKKVIKQYQMYQGCYSPDLIYK